MPTASPLIVQLWSFSYHKGGAPQDESPHGGGFVFDCRGLPNPHYEAELKSKDGRDLPVAQWLTRQQAVLDFKATTLSLVNQTVAVYAKLNRNHLMVSFGCTGGRHRSVFLAECLYSHLRDGGVGVRLRHRELEQISTQDQREKEKQT